MKPGEVVGSGEELGGFVSHFHACDQFIRWRIGGKG